MTAGRSNLGRPLGQPRQCRWRPDAAFYIQMGVVQQVRIRRGFRGAAARFRSRASRLRMSASTAASSAFSPRARISASGAAPDLGVGDHEDLHVRRRADHGSDVAAVEHRPGGRRRNCAGTSGAPRAPRGARHHRAASPTRWLFSTDRRTRRVELGGEGGGARLVARSAPASSMARATGAVDQPGVEMAVVVCARRAACRACPCRKSRRSVDGDDHDRSARAPDHRDEVGEAGGDDGGVVDLHRRIGGHPHHQRRHGDAVVQVGGDEAAPAHALAHHDQGRRRTPPPPRR